jgi:hypothetical protein
MSNELVLAQLERLPLHERVAHLAAWGRDVVRQGPPLLADEVRQQVVADMVRLVQEGVGEPRDRLAVGAALGVLGDPRLRLPSDPGYWAMVNTADGLVEFGRFLVTNYEYRTFVEADGYRDPQWWDAEGRGWLASTTERWPELAQGDESRALVVPNQPVVGVTWYEASAYARWARARLPSFEERLAAVRGAEKRPYPWGSPFGEGNANTREEVLQQPSAVGLFVNDRSPEGIYDLAGNVAEWCADGAGQDRWIHPGAWDQDSMASWAKARVLERPEARGAGLGFRIAREHMQ